MVRAGARLGTEILRALLAAWGAFLFLSPGALAQSPPQEDISSGKYCANCHANALVIWGGKHGTKADSRAPVSARFPVDARAALVAGEADLVLLRRGHLGKAPRFPGC